MVQTQKKRRGKTRGKLSIPKWMTPEMVNWLSNQADINLEKKVESFNESVQNAQKLNSPESIIAYKNVLQDTKETLDTLKSAFSNRKVKQDFHKKFGVPLHKINAFHQKLKIKYRKYRSDYVWAKRKARKVGGERDKQKPQEEGDIMVFTLEETEDQPTHKNELASAVPKRKPIKAVGEGQFNKWISENSPQYKKLENKAEEHRKEAEDAKDAVLFYAKRNRPYELRKSLDRLFRNRHLEIETERELAKKLEALSKEFPEKAGLKIKAKRIRESSTKKTLFPFSDEIQEIMNKTDYSYHRKKRVRGGNPLQTRIKKYLFKQAKQFMDQYKNPPNPVQKIMERIEDAAYNESIDDVEMLSLVTGIEPGEKDFPSIRLAVIGATRGGVRIARGERKGKEPGPKT